MKIDKIKEELLDQLSCLIDYIREESEEVEIDLEKDRTVKELTRTMFEFKKSVLLELPIGSNFCPFCLQTGFHEEDIFTLCLKCKFGEKFGVCDNKGSWWAKLDKKREEMLALIDEALEWLN